ncbi:MAG: DinB family protein [Ignavibacteriae bacterium]|nr:DinB family protein [Ignavibacteriota bacterium]
MKNVQTVSRLLGVALLLCCVFFGALAQEKMKDNLMKASVQGAFLKQSMAIEKKFVDLADAIPQDKYNWRPAEGIRSVAESFLHVAVGNYITLMKMGGKVPEGVNPMQLEKSTTDKKAIVDAVKKSFMAVNDYVKSVPDGDLGKEVDFFGNKMSMLEMIVFASNHQHETLGQSIAYARSTGVAPPWSGM